MKTDLIHMPFGEMAVKSANLPRLIEQAGPQAGQRFVEFFTAHIRNPGTRTAYLRATARFCSWSEQRGLELKDVSPIVVAAYIEELGQTLAIPTVKQHLAALRMLFDWLVVGQVIPLNPAASVRGPKHVVKKGKTPVLAATEARDLLASIPEANLVGLRDRALICVMLFSFARVSATVGMSVQDYYPQGRRMWFRLHEKGSKHHEVPAHHKAEAAMDAYLRESGIENDRKSPLFRTFDRRRRLTSNRMHRTDALRMIQRRARQCGLPTRICCHTFRATGITAYLDNQGSLEHAQRIAAHESIRTTKLYDRTADVLTVEEIERIRI